MRRTSRMLFLGILACSTVAQALEKEYVAPPASPADDQPGWHGSLRVGANVNFTNNRKVVGQQEGNQFQIGGAFDGDIGYLLGEHDWRNSLSLLETFSYGPPVRALMKTADTLRFETAYYYHPVKAPWVGPFVRAGVLTAIFEGADYRATPTLYEIQNETDPDTGNPRQETGKRFRLSESFLPTTLRESAGIFLNPYRKDYLDILILVGGGSTQVFADGQYALKDDATTADRIEVIRLSSYVQAGLEAGLALSGTAYSGKVKYRAYGDVLVPFYRSDKAAGDKRNLGDLTNVELGAMLSFKLVEWASLDYILKALRQPQLVQDWQVQNMLLLTFGYSYSRRQIPPPPPPAAPAP